MNDNSVTKILILAANPLDTVRLSLDREVEEIRDTLSLSGQDDRFRIESRGAIRPDRLQQCLYDVKPQIVHFAGHGMGGRTAGDEGGTSRQLTFISDEDSALEGLVFEDEQGGSKLVSGAAISNLCALFSKEVKCVLLNACYSERQAQEIVKHIPYVVGMRQEIGDLAARKFSQGFYRAIWDDRSIVEAFASGKNAIELDGIPEELTPILLERDLSPAKMETPPVDLQPPTGVVAINSPFYIASPDEERCDREVKKPGTLIRIKSPRKMGKSSLMVRVLNYATQQGYRTVMIDLAQTNHKFLEDQEKFMQWFCASVGKQLGIRVKTEEYWDDIFGANDNSTDYFENYLLGVDTAPIALAIDNFDRVFESAVEQDFCGLLRGWFDRSRNKKQWEQLRLLLVHSQESYAQMDINQSPFNIGLPIELGEFTPIQVRESISKHGLTWDDRDVERFWSAIGGHPYMVRSALYYIACGDMSLDEFLQTAPTEAGIYSDLLCEHLKILEKNPDLKMAMQQLVAAQEPIDLRSEEAFKLDSMGTIRRVGNKVILRCELDRQYFRERLGNITSNKSAVSIVR
jgi:hypothetical protein